MDKKALYKISYGMYIVCSRENERLNGQIANTVFQVTAEPPCVSVAINKENLTHQFIEGSRVFTVSILERDTPMSLIGHFGFNSGRQLEKFQKISYNRGVTGAPVIVQNCLGFLECEVIKEMDAGTHTVFVGRLLEARITGEGEPMTYAYYHDVKNGRSPQRAPTYMKEDVTGSLSEEKNGKYRCKICGYIYDPQKGDPDSGVEPGTAFGDLPKEWVCPVCGAARDQFEKVKS